MTIMLHSDYSKKELIEIVGIQEESYNELLAENSKLIECIKLMKGAEIQLIASKLKLLNEPDVLTGYYRMRIGRGAWEVWEALPTYDHKDFTSL